MKITLTAIKKSLLDGMYSIGEGMYSIGKGMVGIFGYNSRSNVKPLSDEEAWRKDTENLRRNWAEVGKDLGNAIDKLSSIL